jgi:intraflagellar transport protein 81
MTELDSKSGNELLDLVGDILVAIDSEHEAFYKEPLEYRTQRIMTFLSIMKFNIPSEQYDDFQQLLMIGDKEILYTIMHWILQRYEQLQKRSYLAKYLMPLDIPSDFMNDDLVLELSEQLKVLQIQFKDIHKQIEVIRSNGIKPIELKNEITQLEQEKLQLKNKIERMKKDIHSDDEQRFKQMLEVCLFLFSLSLSLSMYLYLYLSLYSVNIHWLFLILYRQQVHYVKNKKPK